MPECVLVLLFFERALMSLTLLIFAYKGNCESFRLLYMPTSLRWPVIADTPITEPIDKCLPYGRAFFIYSCGGRPGKRLDNIIKEQSYNSYIAYIEYRVYIRTRTRKLRCSRCRHTHLKCTSAESVRQHEKEPKSLQPPERKR